MRLPLVVVLLLPACAPEAFPEVPPVAPPPVAERLGTVHCASELDADGLVHQVTADLDAGTATVDHVRPWPDRMGAPVEAPGRLWTGDAEPVAIGTAGFELALPDGHLALSHLEGLGEGTVDGVPLVCWHGTLPSRVGHEPLPDLPSTLADGCAGPLNALPLPFVRSTGVGRCADLTGQALNGDDLRYPALEGYDLRGADLDGATLLFADLVDARLEGTRLAGLEYGYAEVHGTLDATTELPAEGCVVDGDTVACRR